MACLRFLLPLLAIPLLAPPPVLADTFPGPAEGTFVRGGALAVTVDWDGPCNGAGVLTVSPREGDGPAWSVPLQSRMKPDPCEAVGPSCFECPPLLLPVEWTLEGEGVKLAGGGVAYVWSTDAHDVAWSM